jgi:hypothetical protein
MVELKTGVPGCAARVDERVCDRPLEPHRLLAAETVDCMNLAHAATYVVLRVG